MRRVGYGGHYLHVELGADVEALTRMGAETPLFLAASRGHTAAVRKLLVAEPALIRAIVLGTSAVKQPKKLDIWISRNLLCQKGRSQECLLKNFDKGAGLEPGAGLECSATQQVCPLLRHHRMQRQARTGLRDNGQPHSTRFHVCCRFFKIINEGFCCGPAKQASEVYCVNYSRSQYPC